MNREILFRGKRLDNNKWLYGSHFTDSGEDYIIPQNLLGINDYEECQVDQNTVGQFTGLRDKNGVKIFEGDIVKCETFVYKVAYDNKRIASFFLRRDVDMYRHYFGEAMDSDDCEVIGNIYDNPELLTTK